MKQKSVLSIVGMKKYFPVKGGVLGRARAFVRAVDGVSLDIPADKTYGLVGESGSGKTTLGRCAIMLDPPTAGSVVFNGRELVGLPGGELRALRREMQIIFQDPFASLNPRMTVGGIVGEPILIHQSLSRRDRRERVKDLLLRVGLEPAYASRYPHEFSGGQRQRIGIARALALNPRFIVCDEPVSALDVSIQAQVINLLETLQNKYGIAYLFIAHNLAVVRHISDVVGVMYLGKLMEEAPKKDLFAEPLHPYTKALLAAVPRMDPAAKRPKIRLGGDVPSPVNPPSGCPFHPRCPKAMDVCGRLAPELVEVAPRHKCACHLVNPPEEP